LIQHENIVQFNPEWSIYDAVPRMCSRWRWSDQIQWQSKHSWRFLRQNLRCQPILGRSSCLSIGMWYKASALGQGVSACDIQIPNADK
jgi:hypothetical protein